MSAIRVSRTPRPNPWQSASRHSFSSDRRDLLRNVRLAYSLRPRGNSRRLRSALNSPTCKEHRTLLEKNVVDQMSGISIRFFKLSRNEDFTEFKVLKKAELPVVTREELCANCQRALVRASFNGKESHSCFFVLASTAGSDGPSCVFLLLRTLAPVNSSHLRFRPGIKPGALSCLTCRVFPTVMTNGLFIGHAATRLRGRRLPTCGLWFGTTAGRTCSRRWAGRGRIPFTHWTDHGLARPGEASASVPGKRVECLARQPPTRRSVRRSAGT